MISTTLTALCWVVLAMVCPVLTEVFSGSHPVPRGMLVNGWAYAYGRAEWDERQAKPVRPSLACAADVLLRRPLAGGELELFDFQLTWQRPIWPSRGAPAPVRWQIADGRLYSASYSGAWQILKLQKVKYDGGRPDEPPPKDPYATIGSYPLSAEALAACRISSTRRDRIAVERQAVAALRFRQPWVYDLRRFNELFPRNPPNDYERTQLPPADRWRTHFDFVFDRAGRPELFVAAPGRLSRHLLHEQKGPVVENVSSELGTHAPGWSGPFYVAADGPARHFVTGTGVFTLPADAQPGSALNKTWDQAPILALVHDADSGKSYAFTRTHYFHLTAKPAPQPHGIPAFPGATSDEALDTVARCGRVIRGIK